MPIPEQELDRSFVAVGGSMTAGALRELVRARPDQPRYVIVALPQGGYSAPLLSEIARAIEQVGPVALDLPLAQLPPVAEATGAVQRTAMGFGRAARERDRQPRRRLVVLEGERPLGLLTNEARGGDPRGLPFDLFGRYQEGAGDELHRALASRHANRTCPLCASQFVFYELRPDLNGYACPHCHSVLDRF
jgi:hypothetical protein